MTTRPARTPVLILTVLSLGCAPFHAQGKSKSGSTATAGSSPGSSSSTSASPAAADRPFSIETEMFTYKAVEHNSAVIACDTAQYLFNGQVSDAPTGSHAPCIISGASARPGVVLISSGSTLLSDFQNWRADMSSMQGLVAHANQTCVANPEKAGSPEQPGQPPAQQPPQQHHMRSRGLLGSALGSLADPTEAASIAGQVMGMFSSNQSVTSVIGTVQDPALMNEVARQLRALNVQVLIPELYNPYSLGAIDSAHSPYMQNMQSVFDAYDKCSEDKSGYPATSAQAADIDAVLTSIQSFLKEAFASAPRASTAATTAAPVDPGAQTEGTPSSPPSHFASVIAADALARKIGFSASGAPDPNSPWHDLLWVKALESGGSVTKQSNLFGTKVLFGGGAVDTYSVFNLEGDVVCAGNVYSFQQPVNVKDVQKAVNVPSPDPPAKWMSEHSTCAP
ncbi:MAG TPA: hypothetical protein VHE33_05025, partial [Acidobacteriaceae bacterium]|nr:hypothetical protein [Acidobacteriaceae bacterium]